MDWAVAKERNCDALLRVLAVLFALIGLVSGGSVSTVPRYLRLRVLRRLRAAEASARRLLMVEAEGMTVDVPPARYKTDQSSTTKKKRKTRAGMRGFSVIEPLPRTSRSGTRHPKGAGPRISFFDGSDPVFEAAPAPPSPDDDVDAQRLCHRLFVLQDVLENLPKYARRLALWHARRKAGRRSGRVKPIRPGRPPGYTARGRHPVDEILKECHHLALYATRPPDTS